MRTLVFNQGVKPTTLTLRVVDLSPALPTVEVLSHAVRSLANNSNNHLALTEVPWLVGWLVG